MAKYLSDEWFDAVVEAASGLPAIEGMNLAIDVEVAASPDGKVRYHEVWANGQLTAVAAGKADGADVSFVFKYPDAVNYVSGEVTEEVAFMQGRYKIDGAYEKWLYEFRPVKSTSEYADFRAAVAELTEF